MARSREIVPVLPSGPRPPAIAELPRVAPIDLDAALLADARSERTRGPRAQDVANLGRWLRRPDPETAAALVIAGDAGQAHALGLAYRDDMSGRGLSAATIYRRLSTQRRIVALARRFGLVAWSRSRHLGG